MTSTLIPGTSIASSSPSAVDEGEAHAREVARGERFKFGENWSRFLATVDEDRIREAERSLRTMLEVEDLHGRTFLDVGSGSGLFSLAARRLGARVRSFDYDPASVACTTELRRRYFDGDAEWQVGQGSVLDAEYTGALGRFDVVYSWGVLHHTGAMYQAFERVAPLVAPNGSLFIAIYNDQGLQSERWTRIKRRYCSGTVGRWATIATWVPRWFIGNLLADVRHLRDPRRRYAEYRQRRGMSVVHDWLDWLGGYPFEVARPEEVLAFFRERGFSLANLRTVGGRLGCNEFVFRRTS